MPIDRHYLEGFVERNASDIRGAALEVAETSDADRYGRDRVSSQMSPQDRDRRGAHWRSAPQSVERLSRTAFDDVPVEGHGNVLASIGFLHGRACEDVTAAELDAVDDRDPMLVAARAVKTV